MILKPKPMQTVEEAKKSRDTEENKDKVKNLPIIQQLKSK